MQHDSRMSRMLHVLIHMDRHLKRATSDVISKMLGTNPVVVRRTMSGLRDRGYVSSEKGHGGGWELTCSLQDVTLLDVYRAIGSPPLFRIGSNSDHPNCLVEQAVNVCIDETMSVAETMLLKRFSTITVDQIANDFDRRLENSRVDPGISCPE